MHWMKARGLLWPETEVSIAQVDSGFLWPETELSIAQVDIYLFGSADQQLRMFIRWFVLFQMRKQLAGGSIS